MYCLGEVRLCESYVAPIGSVRTIRSPANITQLTSKPVASYDDETGQTRPKELIDVRSSTLAQ